MSMSEKLKADVLRLFHGLNPLDFVEGARITEYPDRALCELTLKVPSYHDLQMRSFRDDEVFASECRAAEFMCDLIYGRAQKAPEHIPEKKIDPMEAVNFLTPKRVVYSGPKTIVFWPDGTKTMVSLMEGQEHDEYGAFCAAVVKKMFGATHKAKKFLESVAVRQESNPRKPKQKAEEVATVEVQTVGSEEVREVPVKPWETTPTMPMPGTEDPDWGRKHWSPVALVRAEEVPEDGV